MYKNIIGIDMFMKYFHDKSWCYFHDILEFKWYRKFDFEDSGIHFYCKEIEIKVITVNGKDVSD